MEISEWRIRILIHKSFYITTQVFLGSKELLNLKRCGFQIYQ